MAASIYGTGVAYPFSFDANGEVTLASEEELVKMSLDQIINTDPNERPFSVRNGVRFGTSVRRSLFESVDTVVDIFRYQVPKAINVWEPRVVVTGVTAIKSIDNPNLVQTDVGYKYRSTNRVDNFVVPYRVKPVE